MQHPRATLVGELAIVARATVGPAAVARVPVLLHRDEILTILQDEVDEPVLRGESEPEPALEQAANEIEKLLAG